jgi:dipeptidyl aminopeptidase/acylaminoacyl peptidase
MCSTLLGVEKAPVLIQHGDNDRRVPPPNAYELYQGLKDVGVPARLVVYKGFGHGINKPKEALHVLDENWNWFEKYVLNATGR